MAMEDVTTIQVYRSTRKKLEALKEYNRETLDEIINGLIREVKTRKKMLSKMSSALLSEKSLAKTWLSKREDEAWNDL